MEAEESPYFCYNCMTDGEFQEMIVALGINLDQAWRTLVRTFEPVLLQFLDNLCCGPRNPLRSGISAGDLLQNTWLRLFEAPARRRRGANKVQFHTFLRMILTRLFLDHCRWLKTKMHEFTDESKTDRRGSRKADPFQIVATAEEWERIQAELADLDRPIVEELQNGKSIPEIAVKLGFSEWKVRKVVKFIRQRFCQRNE